MDRIVLGRKYDLEDWLLDAFFSICERLEPLSLAEASRLSLEDVVKVSGAREAIRQPANLIDACTARATIVRLFCPATSASHHSSHGEHMETLTSAPGIEVPCLDVPPSADESADQGRGLFWSRIFSQSMHSLEQAELQREVGTANAYHLRERARSLESGSLYASTKSALAYTHAGDAFLKCADAGENDVRSYYRLACDCYSHADDVKQAAQAYLSAAEYALAAQQYQKGELFDEAIDLIRSHRESIEPGLANTLTDSARVFYLRGQVSLTCVVGRSLSILTYSQNFE